MYIFAYLLQRQSSDQYGLSYGKAIDHVLLCAEIVIDYYQEFSLELRLISIGICKAFDTIDHQVMVRGLRSRWLPEEYIYIYIFL